MDGHFFFVTFGDLCLRPFLTARFGRKSTCSFLLNCLCRTTQTRALEAPLREATLLAMMTQAPPPPPHNNPQRAPSVKTTAGQAMALRALFLREDAQDWTSPIRSQWFKDLIKEPAFNNLGLNHIRYQWNKYHGEFLIRRQVGAAFGRASKEMAERHNVTEMIFEILASERLMWSAVPYPEFTIPTDMLSLMDKCVLCEAALGQGQFPDSILDESDINKITSLVSFVQGLFYTYGDVWDVYANMELNPTVAVSTRPDLAVSDLELNLLKLR